MALRRGSEAPSEAACSNDGVTLVSINSLKHDSGEAVFDDACQHLTDDCRHTSGCHLAYRRYYYGMSKAALQAHGEARSSRRVRKGLEWIALFGRTVAVSVAISDERLQFYMSDHDFLPNGQRFAPHVRLISDERLLFCASGNAFLLNGMRLASHFCTTVYTLGSFASLQPMAAFSDERLTLQR